jgi:transcriptional antiterminator NusG
VALHKHPGYLLINMELSDEATRLVRETEGVVDFTGVQGKPVPMRSHEVVRMIGAEG